MKKTNISRREVSSETSQVQVMGMSRQLHHQQGQH